MMHSLYAQGYFFCVGCRRYRSEPKILNGRPFCPKCGTRLRTKAKKQSEKERPESRARAE
jgi:rRNA maturation endonuclease Nob1